MKKSETRDLHRIGPLIACPVEGTLWKNPRRLALLDWLIDTIEEELLDELAGEDA